MESTAAVSTQQELFRQGNSAGTRPCRAVILLTVGVLLITSLCFLTGCSGGGNTGGGDAGGVETNGEETPAEEGPVDPREQVLKDYVSTQVEDCGWLESEISYEDNGEGDTVFVYFRPEDMWSQDIQGYDDAMAQDEAYALAKELNSFVYILGYTTRVHNHVPLGGRILSRSGRCGRGGTVAVGGRYHFAFDGEQHHPGPRDGCLGAAGNVCGGVCEQHALWVHARVVHRGCERRALPHSAWTHRPPRARTLTFARAPWTQNWLRITYQLVIEPPRPSRQPRRTGRSCKSQLSRGGFRGARAPG